MTQNRYDGDKSAGSFVALVGDVVGSRSYQQQDRLLTRLEGALGAVNRRVPARQPLTLTVGDEFQGLYDDLASALEANLLLPMYLAGDIEVRVGIGEGPVEVLSNAAAPRGQSGPAWWLAREAIDQVHGLTKGWPAGTLSRFHGRDRNLTGLVNAFLLCHDQIISRMDAIDRRITIGLLLGARQADLATELTITQSTVSARQRKNGPAALVRALESIRGAVG